MQFKDAAFQILKEAEITLPLLDIQREIVARIETERADCLRQSGINPLRCA